MGLFNDELDRILGDYLIPKNYMGTFAIDKMPPLPAVGSNYSCFIVNTSTSQQKGTHWIAIAFAPQGRTIFIDPMAIPHHLFNRYFRNYFSRNQSFLQRLPLTTLPFAVQRWYPQDTNCGKYCAYFLSKLAEVNYNIDLLTERDFSDNDFNYNIAFISNWWKFVEKEYIKKKFRKK